MQAYIILCSDVRRLNKRLHQYCRFVTLAGNYMDYVVGYKRLLCLLTPKFITLNLNLILRQIFKTGTKIREGDG